jgi:hypothetical protein
MKWIFALGSVCSVLLGSALFIQAWETATPFEGAKGWKSLYASMGKTEAQIYHQKNEHPLINSRALKQLGISGRYGFGGNSLMVTDLNASVFKKDLKNYGTYPENAESFHLEQRLIPPPIHFSGIPDYSYALHDWINKNSFCPIGLKEGDLMSPECHDFAGWMGALNANHFGTQSAKTYLQLHELARTLAKRAAVLRRKLEKYPLELKAYKDFIHEAEMEALVVEGYAQHFLDDRWSVGHMWERWNTAEYSALKFKDPFSNLEVAAAAGLLHGSESISKAPDAMCSPYVNYLGFNPITGKKIPGLTTYILPLWRHYQSPTDIEIMGPGDETVYPGVGDLRYEDMVDRSFGGNYGLYLGTASGKKFPLEVGTQLRRMTEASMAGWAEVIRDFGAAKDGGFGINNVVLKGKVKGFDNPGILKTGAWNMWATNSTMVLGWTDSVTSLATLMRSSIAVADDVFTSVKNIFSLKSPLPTGETRVLKLDRKAWAKIHVKVWFYRFKNRDGTELARGGIGDFGGVGHGGEYDYAANYIEPENLEDLPLINATTGMDRLTFYGFFNRAHTDFWCTKADDLIDTLRGSTSEPEQAACRYLADRFYFGTHTRYNGKQKETRSFGQNQTIQPVCAIYGQTESQSDRSSMPITLAPGYVEDGLPGKRSKDGRTYQSVANWCARVPVLDLVPGKKMDEDVVAIVRDPHRSTTLSGIDLGDEPGKLKIFFDDEWFSAVIEVWEDNRIVWHLPREPEFEDRDYKISVVRADGKKSVGRFILRVKRTKPKIETLIAVQDKEVYYHARKGISKRMPPGTVTLKIIFDRNMDIDTPVETEFGKTELAVSGKWDMERIWEGSMTIPDGEHFDSIKGSHPLKILAKAKNGAWLDSDPDKKGAQPDFSHHLRIGYPPPPPPVLDLTGCWGWESDMDFIYSLEINQEGVNIQGNVLVAVPDQEAIEIPVYGTYEPPGVFLLFQHTLETLTLMTPGINQEARAVLLAAKTALRIELSVYPTHTPEGKLEAATMSGRILLFDKMVHPGLDGSWIDEPNQAWLEIVNLPRRGGRHYEFESFALTNMDYRTPLNHIGQDDPFWLWAKAIEGCPVEVERLQVSIMPDGEPEKSRWFTLQETGADTNEFKSALEGLQIPYQVPAGKSVSFRFAVLNRPELPILDLVVDGREGSETKSPDIIPMIPEQHHHVTGDHKTQIDAYQGAMRRQVQTIRRQAAQYRYQAKTAGSKEQAAMLREMADQMEKSSAAMERTIEKSAQMYNTFTQKKLKKRTREEWLEKLPRDIAEFEGAALNARARAAQAGTAKNREIAEKEARQYEAVVQRLKAELERLRTQTK